MPSVFISCSRKDLPLAEELEAQLKSEPDVSVCVWREQEIRETSPKSLGEAIAKKDFFVLVWSARAKECARGELQWNIAVALEKTILLYVTDDTRPPESLRPAQIVRRGDIKALLAAFQNAVMLKAGLLDQIIASEDSKILEQTKAIFGLEALIDRMKVNKRSDVFVVGAGERRITLYSQQVRALNLVYWLWKKKPEDFTKKHILVVGAGAAGLTVAAAAAHLGASVTILEGSERPMAFQLGCRTRLLHPHFYEWPEPFCWKMSAGLPILDWDEGSAGEVAETIRNQFDVIRQATCRITVIDSARRISIELRADTQHKPVVQWKGTRISKQSDVAFTELVLAVGFGVEKTIPGLPLLSYWRDDPLEQAAFLREGKMHQQLIAGNGDGALIDLLRASLWDFDHANFFSSFAAIVRGSILEEEVQRAEREFSQKVQQDEDVSPQLKIFYDNLASMDRDTIAEIDELLLAQLRKNYNVIWLHSDPICWKPESMPLNRFLVSRLLELPSTLLTPERGKLVAVEPSQSRGYYYDACIERPDHTIVRRPVHGVTVRIGVEPALQRFPSVWRKLSEEQRGQKQFNYRLPDERPTPDKFWQRDGKSGILFDSLLKKESGKSHLPTGGGAIWNTELCVKLAPDKSNNPIREEIQEVQRLIYRLIVHLRCVSAEVRRVTYDLHPPLGREKCDAKELRKERVVVLEPPSLWEDGEDKELFKKLVHTESDYTVRVRLDNGQEFVDRLACGLCRHYQNHVNSPDDRSKAESAVKALLRGRPCPRPAQLANLRCLLSGSTRRSPD